MNDNLSKCIDAANSGDYQQGITYLNRNGKFDFLGVIADQYIKEKDGQWIDPDDGSMMGKSLSQDGVKRIRYLNETVSKISMLDYMICEWAGLTQEHIDLIISLNDRERKSFKEISEKLKDIV